MKILHYSAFFFVALGCGALGVTGGMSLVGFDADVARILGMLGGVLVIVGIILLLQAAPSSDPRGYAGAGCIGFGLVGLLLLTPAPTPENLLKVGASSLLAGALVVVGNRLGFW